MNYYDILEVSEKASDEVIKMAYKALVKKYHPDTFNGDPKIAEEKMKEINAAYFILSNAEKRKEYDAFLHFQRSQSTHNPPPPKAPSTPTPSPNTFLQKIRSFFTLGNVILIITLPMFVLLAYILATYSDEPNVQPQNTPQVSIETNIVDHRKGNGPYVGVRTISLDSEETARHIYESWKNGPATEAILIELMDLYGSKQGGGQLYLIEQGIFVDEVDEWCFDNSRNVGDSTIIKSVYGYSICYISRLSPDFHNQTFTHTDSVTENSGYDRFMKQVEDKKAELAKQGQLPTSTQQTQSFSNGQMILTPKEKCICPLTVSVSGSNSYYVYLESLSGKSDIAFMIKPNSTVEMDVPLGKYKMYYATGTTWYGTTLKFGDDTQYYKAGTTLEFTQDSQYYYGHELELWEQYGGNMTEIDIKESDFPG